MTLLIDECCCDFPLLNYDLKIDIVTADIFVFSYSGTWGDHVTLQALANALNITVSLITSAENEKDAIIQVGVERARARGRGRGRGREREREGKWKWVE